MAAVLGLRRSVTRGSCAAGGNESVVNGGRATRDVRTRESGKTSGRAAAWRGRNPGREFQYRSVYPSVVNIPAIRVMSVSQTVRHSRVLVGVVAALVVTQAAGAQIIRLPSRRSAEPAAWTSLSVGLRQQEAQFDGTTGATWDFGGSVEYRGSLEKNLGRGSAFGVIGTYSSVPLTYSNSLISNMNATATVRGLMLGFHAGGTQGFHQAIDISAGVTQYGNFRRDPQGDPIGSNDYDSDFTFVFGYGFGYAFGPRSALTVVQDYEQILHQRDNIPNGQSRASTAYVTRVGLRLGFGSKGIR